MIYIKIIALMFLFSCSKERIHLLPQSIEFDRVNSFYTGTDKVIVHKVKSGVIEIERLSDYPINEGSNNIITKWLDYNTLPNKDLVYSIVNQSNNFSDGELLPLLKSLKICSKVYFSGTYESKKMQEQKIYSTIYIFDVCNYNLYELIPISD